jgi:hypothetical protein
MKQTNDDDFEVWLREKTRAAEPEVSAEFLAAQRRSIYRRIDDDQSHRSRALLRWALSLAMLLVMVAGGITFERRHRPSAQPISDEQLFSDLSAMEQRTEPQAIQPIHSLFEQ